MRFTLFMKHVIKKCPGYDDYWNRYEWQGRRSSHCHGFLWIRDAPNVDVAGYMLSESNREDFEKYWGFRLTAVNPTPGYSVAHNERSPLSLPADQQPNDISALSSVVNRVQHHLCSEAYCLRKKKGSQIKACRFHFLRPEQETPTVTRADNGWYSFHPACNDPLLNSFHPTISLGWLANKDVTPCTSTHAVINYIAKYCSKAETKPQSYKEIVQQLLPKISTNAPLQSLVAKMMNKLIAERDWSAQEVSHILFKLPLQVCSRVVVNLDCRPADEQGSFHMVAVENVVTRLSPQQKYEARTEFLDITLLEFLQNYDHSKCLPHPNDFYSTVGPEDEPEDEFEPGDDAAEVRVLEDADFAELARRRPNQQNGRVEDPDRLGERNFDRVHDWSAHVAPSGLRTDFWRQAKGDSLADLLVDLSDLNSAVDSLTDIQRQIFDVVSRHYGQVRSGSNPPQLLLHVDRRGGTRKSHVLKVLPAHLQDMADGDTSPILRAAPTGIAAHGIRGKTLHALFRLPINAELQPLLGDGRKSLQNDLRHVE
ncbi:hypothetical protein BROUX41_005116 [Berkeleyomyces rouxiae]|uniref:uncharacterized protein n=1 Tax=Berkeleyomyces rouxiae TaxID=2035830 RepID=UPI003B784481